MKKFRGKKVIGWKGVKASTLDGLTKKIDELMEEFDFIDCQYSSHSTYNQVTKRSFSTYSAIVLLAKKEKK